MIQVVNSLETFAHIYWPTQWTNAYLQLCFQLVQYLERVAPFAVEFVHENHNGRVSHATNFHQLACLCFHPFCHVHHYYYTIYCRECAVGVFGKILVTGCVQNVYLVFVILKTHDRSGNRNSSLFLNLHPVGCGSFLYFVRFYCSRNVNGSSKKE